MSLHHCLPSLNNVGRPPDICSTHACSDDQGTNIKIVPMHDQSGLPLRVAQTTPRHTECLLLHQFVLSDEFRNSERLLPQESLGSVSCSRKMEHRGIRATKQEESVETRRSRPCRQADRLLMDRKPSVKLEQAFIQEGLL